MESTFATVRNRSKITKGPGSRRRRNRHGLQADRGGPVTLAGGQRAHLVALVRAGAKFENGKLVERPDDTTATEEAA